MKNIQNIIADKGGDRIYPVLAHNISHQMLGKTNENIKFILFFILQPLMNWCEQDNEKNKNEKG